MTYEMGGLAYAGHDMNGLSYGTIEMGAPVHRAVNTPGLHGLAYGEIEMGGLAYGADSGSVGLLDTVKSYLSNGWDWAMDNKLMAALVVGGGLVVLSSVFGVKVPLLSNKGKKRKGKKRKQTAKQRAASLRNLRRAHAKRRGKKVTASRKGKKAGKRSGKRRVTGQQAQVARLMKQGYTMKQAWRLVKSKGGKGIQNAINYARTKPRKSSKRSRR